MSIGIQSAGGTLVTQALLPAGTDVYFALFDDELATTECTAGGYARVAYTGWTQSMDGLSRSNTAPIEWPAVAGAAVHVGAVGVFDAAVGGNIIHTCLITSHPDGVDVDVGDFLRLPAGTYTLTVV